MKNNQLHLSKNKARWNERVTVHLKSEFYDMEGFRNGRNSLQKIELELLGDVKGLEILHLQCHFGQDTLSLSRMGSLVTGVDFSDQAISTARRLSQELDLPARFICADVLQMDQVLHEQFDLVFTSYGVLGWLPDMGAWAHQIKMRLKPGGRLLLVEFHPIVWMFNDSFTSITYGYFNTGPIIEHTTGTYTDGEDAIKGEEWSWSHSLAAIFTALLNEGFSIEQFKEYDYSPWPCFDGREVPAPNGYQIKGLEGLIPMVFALEAKLPKDKDHQIF